MRQAQFVAFFFSCQEKNEKNWLRSSKKKKKKKKKWVSQKHYKKRIPMFLIAYFLFLKGKKKPFCIAFFAKCMLHFVNKPFSGMPLYWTKFVVPLTSLKRSNRFVNVFTFCSSFFHQAFDKEELIKCLSKLISVEKEWVPYSTTSTLYIRPTFISTEVSCWVRRKLRVRGGGGLCKLIIVEKEWVSYSITSTLYIKPTFISTEVSVKGGGEGSHFSHIPSSVGIK